MSDLDYSNSSINGSFYDDPFTASPLKEAIIISFSLTFILGFLGNLLVIYVIARNKSMHTVTNFFLANLAVADLFVSIFCVIPKLLWFVSPSWEYGSFLCSLHNYVMSATTTVSIFILTVISVERCIAILRPLETRRLLTAGRLTAVMATVWVVSALFNIHTMWFFDVVPIGGIPYCIISDFMMENHVALHVQTLVFVSLYYVIPLLVMAVLYGIIARKLWVSSKLRLVASDREKPDSDRPKQGILTRLARVRHLFRPRTRTPPSVVEQDKVNNGGNATPAGYRQGVLGNFEEARVLLQTQTSITSEGNEGQKIGPFFLDEPDDDSPSTPTVEARIYKPKGNGDPISVRIDIARNKQQPIGKCDIQETTLTETCNGPTGKNTHNVSNNNPPKAVESASKPSQDHRQHISPPRPVTISKSEKSKSKKNKKKETIAARKKVIRLLILVVSSFALCLLPYQIVMVLSLFNIDVPDPLKPAIYLCYFFNSALNPFLYAFFSDNFRKRMRETLMLGSSNRQKRWQQTQWRMRSMTEATETETMYNTSS